MKDYHINIFWSEEDGCYVADIPDLFACSAFGDTPEQALTEVERAKANWLAAAREAGRPIPNRDIDPRSTKPPVSHISTRFPEISQDSSAEVVRTGRSLGLGLGECPVGFRRGGTNRIARRHGIAI